MFNWYSKPAAIPAGPVEWIAVGLGNPGRDYENTRHNAGFCAVERIAGKCGVKIDRLKLNRCALIQPLADSAYF